MVDLGFSFLRLLKYGRNGSLSDGKCRSVLVSRKIMVAGVYDSHIVIFLEGKK